MTKQQQDNLGLCVETTRRGFLLGTSLVLVALTTPIKAAGGLLLGTPQVLTSKIMFDGSEVIFEGSEVIVA